MKSCRFNVVGRLWFCLLLGCMLILAACAPAAPPAPTAAPAPTTAPATAPTTSPSPAPKPAVTAAPQPTSPAAAPAQQSAATPAQQTGSGEKVTIRMALRVSGNYSPFWIGREKGFFKEVGLENVELLEGTGSGNTIKSVATGADMFGGQVNLADLVIAATQNVPVKSVALLHRSAPVGIAYFKDSGIKELKDLKGKNILLVQGSAGSKLVPLMLSLNGLKPTDYNQRFVANDAKAGVFLARQADATETFVTDELVRLQMQGHQLDAFRAEDYGLQLLGAGLLTSDQIIKEKPDLVRRVVRATLKSYQYAKDNPDEGAQIAVKYFPTLDPKITRATLEKAQALFTVPNGEMQREWWEKTQDLLAQSQMIERKVSDVNVLYTNEFLPKP